MSMADDVRDLRTQVSDGKAEAARVGQQVADFVIVQTAAVDKLDNRIWHLILWVMAILIGMCGWLTGLTWAVVSKGGP